MLLLGGTARNHSVLSLARKAVRRLPPPAVQAGPGRAGLLAPGPAVWRLRLMPLPCAGQELGQPLGSRRRRGSQATTPRRPTRQDPRPAAEGEAAAWAESTSAHNCRDR